MLKNEELKNEVTNLEVEAELTEEMKKDKKAEMLKLAKKVGKIVGIASLGVVGYFIGVKTKSNSECNVADLIDMTLDNE